MLYELAEVVADGGLVASELLSESVD